jgi:hypothetical protein
MISKELEAIFLVRTGGFNTEYYIKNNSIETKNINSSAEMLAENYIVNEENGHKANQWFKKDTTIVLEKKLSKLTNFIIVKILEGLGKEQEINKNLILKIINYVSKEELSNSKDFMDFCSQSYALLNKDIAEAGLSPFAHFYMQGIKEKRQNKKIPKSLKENIYKKFDIKYYKNKYKIVQGCAYRHYFTNGFYKNYRISKDFDPIFYFNFYKDIQHAKLHPVFHYFTQGLIEERLGSNPWEFVEEGIKTSQNKIITANKNNKNILLGKSKIFINDYIDINSDILLSVSHDDYLNNNGGVQDIIKWESSQVTKIPCNHIHISPVFSGYLNYNDTGDQLVNVNINGVSIGRCVFKGLLQEIEMLSNIKGIVLHSLIGWSFENIRQLIKFGKKKVIFYIHDFSILCVNYMLRRNNGEFCNAPDIKSNSCRVCAFGKDREDMLSQLMELINLYEIKIYYNSEFTKSFIESRIGVQGIVDCPLKITIDHNDVKSTKINRVAYVGPVTIHKGSGEFIDFVEKYTSIKGLKFYHIISDDITDAYSFDNENIEKIIYNNKKISLTEALLKNKIEAIWLYRNCTETFSITMFEALEANIIPIINLESGNIFHYINENEIDHILINDGIEKDPLIDLNKLYRSKKITKKIRDVSYLQDLY